MRRGINFIVFTLIVACPSVAVAQRRLPAAASGAVGGDLGVFIAREAGLGSGLSLDGFYEYYFTPRTSVRLGLGWANPSYDHDTNRRLRHLRVGGDVVSNWERGAIHPFAGAGLGVYFLQTTQNGESVGDSETRVGGAFFGGVEYFTSRTVALKGEARYALIKDLPGTNPDGLTLMVGIKKYF
jgi:hypothetical protein